ncbi:hypothetical protein D3C77_568920 [compost metagenome]
MNSASAAIPRRWWSGMAASRCTRKGSMAAASTSWIARPLSNRSMPWPMTCCRGKRYRAVATAFSSAPTALPACLAASRGRCRASGPSRGSTPGAARWARAWRHAGSPWRAGPICRGACTSRRSMAKGPPPRICCSLARGSSRPCSTTAPPPATLGWRAMARRPAVPAAPSM